MQRVAGLKLLCVWFCCFSHRTDTNQSIASSEVKDAAAASKHLWLTHNLKTGVQQAHCDGFTCVWPASQVVWLPPVFKVQWVTFGYFEASVSLSISVYLSQACQGTTAAWRPALPSSSSGLVYLRTAAFRLKTKHELWALGPLLICGDSCGYTWELS